MPKDKSFLRALFFLVSGMECDSMDYDIIEKLANPGWGHLAAQPDPPCLIKESCLWEGVSKWSQGGSLEQTPKPRLSLFPWTASTQ